MPGKVLAPLLGRPMIARHLERLARATRLDRMVVVTSTDPGDDALAALCAELGVECFRGSLDDVLDRFHAALAGLGADHCVRLTADCPLADPALIDALVEFHLAGNYEYSSNCERRTYPDGLDAEIVRVDVLDRAWREARERSDREHVTTYVRRQPAVFRIGGMEKRRRSRGPALDGRRSRRPRVRPPRLRRPLPGEPGVRLARRPRTRAQPARDRRDQRRSAPVVADPVPAGRAAPCLNATRAPKRCSPARSKPFRSAPRRSRRAGRSTLTACLRTTSHAAAARTCGTPTGTSTSTTSCRCAP